MAYCVFDSQGAITTALGVGAALSTSFAGIIVVYAEYSSAFLFLAAVASVGLAVFWLAMPETLDSADRQKTKSKAIPAVVSV